MEIGILVQGYVREDSNPQQRVREVIAEARCADELGLAAFGVSEQHFKYPTNSCGPITAILAAVAQATKQIKIVPGVVILPFHHPLNVAENWAAIDIISEGRLYFGIGKGNTPLTADVFRVPIKDTDPLTGEALEIIIRSWTQEKFSYEGKYFRIPEIGLCPRPWRTPHPPIGMAGTSVASARYAGERKLGFMTAAVASTLDDLREFMEAYDEAWATGIPIAGATPDNTKSLLVHGQVGESMEDVKRQVETGIVAYVNRYVRYKRIMLERSGRPDPNFGQEYIDNFDYVVEAVPNVLGTPDQVIPKLLRMKKMGFDRVDVTLDYAKHEDILNCIRLLATRVAPAVK